MREIKFRAWDTKSESMEYEIAIGKGYSEDSYILFLGLGETFIIDEDIIKIMQYTGLKDKNGVEIYEGDVCKTVHSAFRDDDNTIGIVEFYNGRFSRKIKYPSGQYNYHDLFNFHCEVIGNIYKNPDLLKG